ncbi:DUF3857 domain-containing protein [Hymenobacter properus]|uniref:DUF3857 domain-containing protein n=1 Tax=Hymenobacter properus TaxID=2791026 RepID=A0A931FK10_9BACT|nr:DUF3857 domain-containing protein [Hymenobacter properus]MBF9143502.1 DUF3857 domain-containing protein [Hymenobacter properus]MBR7722315.1 DUF3857 domain-containing protein [Microvirga sp. SRT04]
MPTSLLLRRGQQVFPLLTAACLGAFTARAQPEPVKFGQVDKADLTAAPFVADSAATAVVLCDFGRSRMEGKGDGLQVVFERVTRIKILKKAGFENATVEIPLYHREADQEKVSNLRGFTYNLVNGVVEKTKLEPTGAFLENRTPTINIQKFTLPNVREGSVIEYAYTLRSDFLFNFQDWTFQRDVPVRWSEYRVSIPAFYKYKIIYQGGRPFDVDVAKAGVTSLTIDNKIPLSAGLSGGISSGTVGITAPTEEHQWVLKNVPAFREEPYMTTARDYVARLDFELTAEQWSATDYHDLTGTWDKINARLLADEDFGGRLSRSGPLKDQVLPLTTQYPAVADRIAAVRQLVMAAVRYDGRDRCFAQEPLRKAYDAHRGSAADVNLLLIAALRDAGIDAHPLILSTRDHGRVSQEFPLLERFNYVVAAVPQADGKDLLVDATEPLLPCGVLPTRCLNRVGRLVMKKDADGRWVDLTPSHRQVRFQQINLTLDAQGGLSGKVHDERGGYAGANARAELASLGEKKYLAGLLQRHEGWAVPKLTVGQTDAVDKPFTLDYEFRQPATDNAAATTLYLSPLSDFGPGQNPFRHEDRSFSVDFGMLQEETVMVTLTLPAGYELAALPKPAVVDLPEQGGRFIYSVAAVSPGVVQLTSRLNLRKPVYAAAEYASLRELYSQLMARQAEKLVIQKKAGG